MRKRNCLIVLMAVLLAFVSQSIYATPVDTSSTIAIWNMDASVGGYVIDASTKSEITRNLWLTEDRSANGFTNHASITTGSAGVEGEALYFPGLAVARSIPFYSVDWTDIKVDFWLKVETFPGADAGYTAYIMSVGGVFRVGIDGTNLRFEVLNNDGNRLNGSLPCAQNISSYANQWLHMVAGYDSTTQGIFMAVKDASETLIGSDTKSVGAPLNARNTNLEVGAWIGKPAERSFNGWLDNVQFTSTVVPEPATIAMLSLGVLMFRKKR